MWAPSPASGTRVPVRLGARAPWRPCALVPVRLGAPAAGAAPDPGRVLIIVDRYCPRAGSNDPRSCRTGLVPCWIAARGPLGWYRQQRSSRESQVRRGFDDEAAARAGVLLGRGRCATRPGTLGASRRRKFASASRPPGRMIDRPPVLSRSPAHRRLGDQLTARRGASTVGMFPSRICRALASNAPRRAPEDVLPQPRRVLSQGGGCEKSRDGRGRPSLSWREPGAGITAVDLMLLMETGWSPGAATTVLTRGATPGAPAMLVRGVTPGAPTVLTRG